MADESELVSFEEDDGSVSTINVAAAQKQVALMVRYMTQRDTTRTASTELMRISAETKSSAYVRFIADESVRLLSSFLLEQASTVVIPFAVSHLQHFILAYRTLRPVEQDPDLRNQSNQNQ